MKAKDLIALLQANPEAEIVREGDDHSYIRCNGYLTTAIMYSRYDYFEDYPEHKLTTDESRVTVIVMR